ncbi:hypothetical protein QYE76_018338 [Lolium multiflorum]|uniref:CCHC-type domain-containing protein n=1 Tax=Lolium multiflorum TaxID=4521 RepID=A0AAD8Q610_LOLMU|nr:hypothetical protein QYE76_018338 [Lolium multiflorum]
MVGRGRPPLPPQVARDEGIRPRRRNMEDEENMYGKLKFNMPKFKGEDDAEAYLSWALKVDKIFRIHNYSGAKKVAMASLEFEDYANTWWEQVVTLREEKGDPPIDTWEDMKEEMEARFVPKHYKTDLFNKLQKLKQGTKTVEEFFKEMELTMMRANIQESENQTIARFFNGLNYPIKRIVEFQQYSNMVELVHQASKAERQVNEDIKYSKSKQYFASKLATSTPTTSVKPTASSTPSKQPSIQSRMKQTVSSTASSKASTGPSNVTCFKCGTQGHKSFECKNTKVMITMENGDIETLSEGEYEALVQAAVANEEEYDEESGEDPLLCTHDPSPSLVVTRVLTTQPQAMEDQRCNIFQTRAGIGGKSIKVIIDGGSCHNLASTELCEKLNLTLRKHPHPYHVQWLSDKGNVKIQHTVTVNFKIGPYEDTVECDVVPMTVCHMLLGRPWQFDKKAIHDGFSNAYTFKVKDKKFELRPMTPSQIIADNAKALARAQHHIHHSELRGEGATHQKESERHHPHMSERKSVLLTTKSEWREVKDNPSTTIHYVLICKGLSSETNDLTNIPSSLLSLLKEFQDVFPDELPHGLPPLRGIEHRIDLIPGAPYQTAPPTAPTPKIPRRSNDKYKTSSLKGSALAPESLVLRRITFRDHQPSTCFLAPTAAGGTFMSITLGAATKLLDDMMINYSEWHTERAPQGKKVNSVEETSSLNDKIDVIMSMLVNGRSNVDPNNVPLASLVAQEENVDVNFIKNNNFNNNAYRNNSGNNYRPYPSANGNGYGNSYGNSYNNNRNVPSGLEAMLKEFISTQTAFNKSVEEKLDKIDTIASRVDRLASDVNLLKLKVMPNNDIDNKITTTANAIQVRINENIRLMAELRARWDREENEKLAKENNVAKVWTITTTSNANSPHVAAPPTINGKIIGVGNVSTPSAKRTKLPEIAKTAETACDKTAEIFSNLGNNDPIAVAHNDLDFDDCHISEVIKFLQKLAKSPNASAINLAFTKHITNALIKAREEKLKLETSIPRKLEDGWEPIIKMKFNDFECNALCDLGASISVMPKKIYDMLDLPPLKNCYLDVNLADNVKKKPLGRIDNVHITVNNNLVPVDFVVLDIECNASCPIVLGRPFLRTVGAVIDMREGNIKYQFPLKKGMEHFPRKRMKLPFDSIIRTSYDVDASTLDVT